MRPADPFTRPFEDGLPTRRDRIQVLIEGIERTYYDPNYTHHADSTGTMLTNHLNALRWWLLESPP